MKGTMKKAIKLNESQLRKLVAEALDPDAETARRVVDSFLDAVTNDPAVVRDAFVNDLGYALGDEGFYPGRIEDIEPMADAVAAKAAQMLVNAPGFQAWLSSCIAEEYRKSLG